jgi:hypothetical protein
MPLTPHHISLATKTWSPIHRDSPTDYVSTIHDSDDSSFVAKKIY